MAETIQALSPQVREYLESLLARGADRPVDIKGAREQMRESARVSGGEPEAVASAEDVSVNGVRGRLYRPVGGERDILVYFHGGGWASGDVDSYDQVVRALANRAGCAVLSVEYRRSPEHAYPAALDDCWSATAWAVGRFDRVAVGGDSAGGNLAAAVALRAREEGVHLALQLLVYPVLDYAAIGGPFWLDFIANHQGFPGIPAPDEPDPHRAWHQMWAMYVPEQARRLEPRCSPAQAHSLAGVAPVVLINAEHDILRGEAEAYAKRLETEGVPVEVLHYNGQIHGFFTMLGVMDDAHDAVNRSASSLQRAFAAV